MPAPAFNLTRCLPLLILALVPCASWAQEALPPAPVPAASAAPGAEGVSSVPLSGPIRKVDVLRVLVAGSELGGIVRVENDGTISLPRLGQILVGSRETAAAARLIAARIEERKLLRQADVAVYIVGRKPEEVSIYGAVGQPGRQPLREEMLLSDAVETASPQATADLSRVIITRRTETEKARAGERIAATPRDITVDYRQFRTGASRDVQFNPPLRDGDRVFVFQLLPATAGTVRLTGELKDPTKASVAIAQGETAVQVLQTVGGLSDYADRNKIVVVRTDTDGSKTALPLPYDEIVRGDRTKDITLLRGDEISVPRAERPRIVYVDGAVRDARPVPYRAGITLQEVIAQAGGPIEGARLNEIKVSRQTAPASANASANVQAIKYDLNKATDAATVLQDGDIVTVQYPRRREGLSVGTAIAGLSGLAILFSQLRR